MIVFDHVTYAAVITIDSGELPAARLTVTLTPSSSVLTANGEAKPLRDCTLLELEQYAARVESSVAETLHAIRLDELDESAVTQVRITLLPERGDEVDSNWESLAIVLPAESEAEARDNSPDAADIVESSAGEAPAQVAAVEAATGLAGAQDGEAAASVVDDVNDDPPERVVEVEPEVTVAPPEPVHEEREAAEAPGPESDPARRVAGRRRGPEERTWMAVDILIDESAFRAAQAHALSSLSREVAGVLVGPAPEKQPNGRYVVHVTDTIIALHTRMHGASVTYTPESWRYLNDELARRYPDESAVMVGWYHTHPGFGIFLSGMDQFIHQNFFTQRWHIAFVLDPIARRSGFFCWDSGQREVRAADFPWPSWAAGSW